MLGSKQNKNLPTRKPTTPLFLKRYGKNEPAAKPFAAKAYGHRHNIRHDATRHIICLAPKHGQSASIPRADGWQRAGRAKIKGSEVEDFQLTTALSTSNLSPPRAQPAYSTSPSNGTQHRRPAPAPATCLQHVHSQLTAPAPAQHQQPVSTTCTASSQRHHQHRHPAANLVAYLIAVA